MGKTSPPTNSNAIMASVQKYLDLLLSDEIDLDLPDDKRAEMARAQSLIDREPTEEEVYNYFLKRDRVKFERWFTLRIWLANNYEDARDKSEGDNPEKSYTAKYKNMQAALEAEGEIEKLQDQLFRSTGLGGSALQAGKQILAGKTLLDEISPERLKKYEE